MIKRLYIGAVVVNIIMLPFIWIVSIIRLPEKINESYERMYETYTGKKLTKLN